LRARLAAGLLLLLTACAVPAVPEAERAATPVTAWPPSGPPRAVIVALHGFNDYRASFDEFGRYAAQHGILVEAYDQPGFGARPDRGRWPGTPALVAALDEAILDARRRNPAVPLFVLGESMGAAVAMVALSRPEAPAVSGLILAAPAVWNGNNLPSAYRTTLRVLAAVLPPLRVSARKLNRRASDNLEMLLALGRDPLYLRQTRIDGIAGLVELMIQAQGRAPTLRLPMLVLLGARDQIVPPQSSDRFVATLDPANCSVVTYLDGWHLLLRDFQRQRVFTDIDAWVAGQPLPSGLDRPCGPLPVP
jgi:acylglycerol lipase